MKFRALAGGAGVKPKAYCGTIDALEAVDMLEHIETVGDQALGLLDELKIPSHRAEAILASLLRFYSEPLACDRRTLAGIANELRRYE